ncbi:MAG: ABC transporter substrate-binding protein [Acidimicrobiales bacterium]
MMPTPRRQATSRASHWLGTLPFLGAVLLLVVALLSGNAAPLLVSGGQRDGVYPHRVVVGGIVSQLGSFVNFSPVFDGVRAYFDTVNATGGVYGRKLDLAYTLNDSVSPATDAEDARTLVEQDHVFAVVGVETPSFSGASFLRSHQVPTFGTSINTNATWAGSPVMFALYGGVMGFEYPDPMWSYLPQQLGDRVVAVLAYNFVQSQQGCEGALRSFHKFGIRVGFEDMSLPIPLTGMNAVVARMKAAHVGLVVSCMDLSGSVLLSDALHQQGMGGVHQLWMSGYDPASLQRVGSAMNGVYTIISTVPFDAPSRYPGSYPGMAGFLAALGRYFPGVQPSESALAGWVNANLFVRGLRAAGPLLTRARLVAAINRMSTFTAGRIVAPVDWQVAHDAMTPGDCHVYLQVVHGRFVPVFGSRRSVWTCFPDPYPPVRPPARIARIPATTGGIGIAGLFGTPVARSGSARR